MMLGGRRSSLRLLAAALSLATLAAGSAETEEQCRSLGFTGLQLCSDCDTMASYVNNEELVSDCRRCCTRGKSTASQKYHSAVLEAYLERLSAFPHIEGFVNREAAKYKPALKVRNRYGGAPRLVLKTAEGASEVVRVDGWKTEHVSAFLDEKLDLAADAEEAEGAKAAFHDEGLDSQQ